MVCGSGRPAPNSRERTEVTLDSPPRINPPRSPADPPMSAASAGSRIRATRTEARSVMAGSGKTAIVPKPRAASMRRSLSRGRPSAAVGGSWAGTGRGIRESFGALPDPCPASNRDLSMRSAHQFKRPSPEPRASPRPPQRDGVGDDVVDLPFENGIPLSGGPRGRGHGATAAQPSMPAARTKAGDVPHTLPGDDVTRGPAAVAGGAARAREQAVPPPPPVRP